MRRRQLKRVDCGSSVGGRRADPGASIGLPPEHFMKTIVHCLLPLLTAACGWAHAAVAPSYAVTDLGDFYATGVNDAGWVSGYDGRALLWQPGNGLTDLGAFGPCGGGCSNRANAINNAGQVVGYAWSPALSATRAFVSASGGALVDLGDLPQGGNYTRAEAINAFGVAAGQGSGQYVSHPTYGNQSFNHAVVFAPPGNPVDLEAHAEGTQVNIARGINDFGVVVGDRQTSSGMRAIVWADDGSALNLGALWGATGTGAATNSFARDVNNLGQVALQLPLGSGVSTAAVWHSVTGFTEIGRLGGASTASANAINDAGVVVGSAGQRGFAWSFADGLLDLNTRLDPVAGAGWLIMDANGISESGLIVGRAFSPTLGYRAVMLSPVPEPSTALLLAVGLAVVVLGRVGRRRGTAEIAAAAQKLSRG